MSFLIQLILASMGGQLFFILADVRTHLEDGSFQWSVWRKRNLALSILSLLLSAGLVAGLYFQGVQLTIYEAILQGFTLDSFLKLTKTKTTQ